MPPRFDICEENGMVLARMPCEFAFQVIERLTEQGVHATYSIRASHLLIHFFGSVDRKAAESIMDQCMVKEQTGMDAAAGGNWMRELWVGQFVRARNAVPNGIQSL